MLLVRLELRRSAEISAVGGGIGGIVSWLQAFRTEEWGGFGSFRPNKDGPL